ncbi:MAG TPA: class I SAM-dependent methyltransferase [Solirubrobacteraceae bacterium]|nr:class I SAM-dependent methyltransferase [Solirubrobacteraceae bacterium]
MTVVRPDAARDAYRPLAPVYDLFTAHHRHDVWLDRLEALARRHGLAGRRVLDVGCGTGKSFLPLVRRGYRVTGCDISPAMLAEARRAAPAGVRLVEADMRALPDLGEFDLVTCLDDAVNYLLGDDDLTDALTSMRGALAAGGVLVFDTNTLATYGADYTRAQVVEGDDVFVCWRGDGVQRWPDGGHRAQATIEIFRRAPAGLWAREQSVHRQRHRSRAEVERALDAAGLRCVAVLGQRTGAVLEDRLDESAHTKALFVARPA